MSIGVFVTIVWQLILYLLRPNLKIEKATKEANTLRITVKNHGCFDAVNLRIEACCIHSDKTYHFEIDKEDFLILPKRNRNARICTRTFKIDTISKSAKKYADYPTVLNWLEEQQDDFRIRLHAYHSFSGFGKAFEQYFKWANGKFIKI